MAVSTRATDITSVVALWVAVGIAAGIALPIAGPAHASAVGLGILGLAVVAALIVQVLLGRAHGYIVRVAASVAGAMIVVGAIAAVVVVPALIG